jgi:hypothetical protein
MRHGGGLEGENETVVQELLANKEDAYSLTEDLVGLQAWDAYQSQQEMVNKWLGESLNVERKKRSLAPATRASSMRTMRDVLGYAVRCRAAPATLATMLDGDVLLGYVHFLERRGCKASTRVKALCHVSNVLTVLESPTGRRLVTPMLTDEEVGAARELRGQAMALVNQLGGEPKGAVVTPRQLVAEGHWPSGGHITLQAVAAQRARRVLDAAQPLLSANLHSPQVARVASDVSDVCMALLMTQLPTPRPRSLYTLVTKGVHGVSPPSSGRYCSVTECKRETCPGNVLERVGFQQFVFVQSHHKTERLVSVPTIHLSAAAGSAAILLECLELVYYSALPPPSSPQHTYGINVL